MYLVTSRNLFERDYLPVQKMASVIGVDFWTKFRPASFQKWEGLNPSERWTTAGADLNVNDFDPSLSDDKI